MSVKHVRSELSKILPRYQMIEDTLSGEEAVKDQKDLYLPVPVDEKGDVRVSSPRYQTYLKRAVYYNMVKPTLDALVGQLFLRQPKVEIPTRMDAMLKDVNGEGLDIDQLVRLAANHVLPYGRAGFLTDFPKTNGEVTQAQFDGGMRPCIKFYSPWAITNWLIEKVNRQKKLTLLVLKEIVEVPLGDFDTETVDKHRVYRLVDNKVTVEIWLDEKVVEPRTVIKDAKGKALDTIPFEFIGADNNDAEIDEPPLYCMATLNLGHYRNSADYEESVFLTGQPTPVYIGLTERWVDNYFEKGVPFGSRASIPLPENSDAKLLQANPNTLAFEAMTHKEHQMIAIGAKLINPNQRVERKEAEIQIEAANQKSVLMTIKDNLQKAMEKSLRTAALFVGTNPDEISVELNDNFDLTTLTAEEIRWMIELFKEGNIDYATLHENLRRSGIVKNTAVEMKTSILGDVAFRKQTTLTETKSNAQNDTNTE